MSTNKSTNDIDEELATRVADNTRKRSVETLQDVHPETQALVQVARARVSMSPNKSITNTEDNNSDDDIALEEESTPEDSGKGTGTDEEEDSVVSSNTPDEEESVEEENEETEVDAPIGWMSAQLKILEDEARKLKDERRKIKGQNSRLQKALANRKAKFDEATKEIKALKKENNALSKKIDDYNIDLYFGRR